MVSKGRLSPADAEIEDLEVSYSFPSGRDRARIVCILRAKPPAVAILKEAVAVLRSTFGPSATLSLELDRDPESGFEEIFATVQSPHASKVALELMANFDRNWWVSRLRDVSGKLNFIWKPSR